LLCWLGRAPSPETCSHIISSRIYELTGCDGQALQNAVERLSQYVTTLEDKMEALERKKK
jgi:hypothetical protein